jgi:hypothetical protein
MIWSQMRRLREAHRNLGSRRQYVHAWTLKTDPFTWHEDEANPVFAPAPKGWDSHSIRLDCVLHISEEDAYDIYYSGTDVPDAQNRIGLAICAAGTNGYSGIVPAAIHRDGATPALAPEHAEPFCVTLASQAAVLRESDADGQWQWYMYYSCRGRNGVLPGIGPWTKIASTRRPFSPSTASATSSIKPSERTGAT